MQQVVLMKVIHQKAIQWLNGSVTAGVQESRVACLTFLVAKRVDDLDRLHFKWYAAVLTEHGAHRVEYYLGLSQVCCSDLYEDILCVQADLHQVAMVTTAARQSNCAEQHVERSAELRQNVPCRTCQGNF